MRVVHRLTTLLFHAVAWVLAVTMMLSGAVPPEMASAATTQTFTTSGSWTAPTDVTSVLVEAWGGGGAGGGRGSSNGSAGGGGGGAFASATVTVTPGNNYAYTVAAAVIGSTGNGTAGNLSQWESGTAVKAAGGGGGLLAGGAGLGGTVADSVGTVRFKGGDGAAGTGTISGGGGGGSGSTAAGSNATAGTGGTATADGGGAGGAGVTNANGNPGAVAGGGGAGARRTSGNRSGGNGAAGQIRITYAVISVSVADASVAFGLVAPSTSKDTTSSGVNDTQVATNAGDSPENFNILASGSATWTLGTTPGNEQFALLYCTTGSGSPDPCDSGGTWTPLTTSYQSLATNIAAAGTRRFDLRFQAPTNTITSNQQTFTVTVQAVAP